MKVECGKSMGTYGNLWESMGTYGNLWESMGAYGNLWEYMGNLWLDLGYVPDMQLPLVLDQI